MTIFFYWWRLLLQIFHTTISQKMCHVSQNNATVLSSLIVTLNNALFNDCTPDIVGHNSIKLFVFLQLRYAALWTEKKPMHKFVLCCVTRSSPLTGLFSCYSDFRSLHISSLMAPFYHLCCFITIFGAPELLLLTILPHHLLGMA